MDARIGVGVQWCERAAPAVGSPFDRRFIAIPIVFPFNDPTSPTNATWSTTMAADVANLMAGNLYVNVHSQ